MAVRKRRPLRVFSREFPGYTRDLGGDYTGCPKCGFVGDLDDFDVLGMPEGILWCNQCDQPIKPIQLEKEPGRVEVDTLTNR